MSKNRRQPWSKIPHHPLEWLVIQLALAMLLCIKLAAACDCMKLTTGATLNKYEFGLPYHGQCQSFDASNLYARECYTFCGAHYAPKPVGFA